MNGVIEKQPDGTWTIVESKPEKAELKQTIDLKSLGFTDEEIAKIEGRKGEQTANLEASASGFLNGIVKTEVSGIPVGAAAAGAALTIIVDRLVIRKLDKDGKWGVWANLGAAFVIKKYAGKFLGTQAADVTALLLTYEAVADWVTGLIDKVIPAATMSQMRQAGMNQGSVMNQVNAVAKDYYARSEGR